MRLVGILIGLITLAATATADFDERHEEQHRQEIWQHANENPLHDTTRDFSLQGEEAFFFQRVAQLESTFTYRLDGGPPQPAAYNTDYAHEGKLVTFEAQWRTETAEPGTRSSAHWIIANKDCDNSGGNGGTRCPSMAHTVYINHYDDDSDTDGDGMKDAYELEHWGHDDHLGSDDPDGDGYSNTKEMQGCSDPNDATSTPDNADCTPQPTTETNPEPAPEANPEPAPDANPSATPDPQQPTPDYSHLAWEDSGRTCCTPTPRDPPVIRYKEPEAKPLWETDWLTWANNFLHGDKTAPPIQETAARTAWTLREASHQEIPHTNQSWLTFAIAYLATHTTILATTVLWLRRQ